jgi:hypothetical protein
MISIARGRALSQARVSAVSSDPIVSFIYIVENAFDQACAGSLARDEHLVLLLPSHFALRTQ